MHTSDQIALGCSTRLAFKLDPTWMRWDGNCNGQTRRLWRHRKPGFGGVSQHARENELIHSLQGLHLTPPLPLWYYLERVVLIVLKEPSTRNHAVALLPLTNESVVSAIPMGRSLSTIFSRALSVMREFAESSSPVSLGQQRSSSSTPASVSWYVPSRGNVCRRLAGATRRDSSENARASFKP